MNVIRGKENRVCFVATYYTLLLYLLYSSMEDINNTHFIFGDGFDNITAKRFIRHTSIFGKPNYCSRSVLIEWLYSIYLRIFVLPKFSSNVLLFAQDHVKDSGTVISNHNYILIEDSAHKCSNYRNHDKRYQEDERMKKSLRYLIKKMLFGGSVYGKHGNNNLCKGVLLSEYDEVDYFKGKEIIICNMNEAWRQSSQEKKDFILNVFDLKPDDIVMLKRDNILFTQPLFPDVLTEEEHVELYKRIISNYNIDDLIIKTHPRDNVPYEKLFPGIPVYRKKIPSQLIEMVGVHYKKAITVFSSAAISFSYSIQVDWYGTESNDKLLNLFGHYTPPLGANVCRLIGNEPKYSN